MAEAFTCACASSPPSGPSADQFRQARKIQTGQLSNVYLPVDLIPDTGGADFEFYLPDDGFCYRIAFADPILDSAGFVPAGWEPFETTDEHDRLCAGSLPTYYQAVRSGTTTPVDVWVNTADAPTLPFTLIDNGVCYTVPTGAPPSGDPGYVVDAPVEKTGESDPDCEACLPANFEDNYLVPLGYLDTVNVSSCDLALYLGSAPGDSGTFASGVRNYTYAKGDPGTAGTPCPCPNNGGDTYVVTRQADSAAPVYRRARQCDDQATLTSYWRAESLGLPYHFTADGLSLTIDATSPTSVSPSGTILDGSETPCTDCHHTAGNCIGASFGPDLLATIDPGDTAFVSSCWLAAYLGVSAGSVPTSGSFVYAGSAYTYAALSAGTAGTVCPCESGGTKYTVTRTAAPVYRQGVRCSPTISSIVDVTDPNVDPSFTYYFFGASPPDAIDNQDPNQPSSWSTVYYGGGVKWVPTDAYWTADYITGTGAAGGLGLFQLATRVPRKFTADVTGVWSFNAGPFTTYGAEASGLPLGVKVWNQTGAYGTPDPHDAFGARTITTAPPRYVLLVVGDTRANIVENVWIQDGTAALPLYLNVGGVGYRFDLDSPTDSSPGTNLVDPATATHCTNCADAAVVGCNARALGDRIRGLPPGWRLEVSECWLKAFVYWMKGITAGSTPSLSTEERFQYGGRWYIYRDSGLTGTYGMECQCPDGTGKRYWVWPADHYCVVRRCSTDGLTTYYARNTYLSFFVSIGGVSHYSEGSRGIYSALPAGGTAITDAMGHVLTGYTETASCT